MSPTKVKEMSPTKDSKFFFFSKIKQQITRSSDDIALLVTIN